MSKRQACHALILIAAVLAAGIHPPAAGAEESAAAARVAAMANFLAKSQRLRVAVDCTYEVVQDSGEKIEFGERRTLTLRRPDRARVDVTRRDGSRGGLLFDGTQLTVFDTDEKVYSIIPKTGTLDAALEYYTRDLGMRLPLRELFAADLAQKLKEPLATARLVGKETVGGVATDHVALRVDTADVQLWIACDGDPLPRRIVITYRLAEGQPQFEADFDEWTFTPDVPDSAFVFVPASGAEKIPILTPRHERQAEAKQP